MRLLRITLYILKNELRNRQAVIFSLLLPVALLVLVGTTEKSEIGYLYPGIMAIAFGTMGLVGVSSQLTGYAESGVLKRINITDISVGMFIILDYLTQVIFMCVQFVIITLVAKYGYNLKFSIDHKYLIYTVLEIFLAMIALMSVGTLVAGLSRNVKTASTIGNSVMVIMLFLGNTLFPSNGWPKWIVKTEKVLPMNTLTESMRNTLIYNSQTMTKNLQEILWSIVILVICTVIGMILINRKINVGG